MARRKTSRVKRYARKTRRTVKKTFPYFGAMLYGASRAKVDLETRKLAAKYVPGSMQALGDVGDEVTMFGVSWLADKYGNKVPMVGKYVKQAGKAEISYTFVPK